jgi:pimeloyl-ACP methyl ester carboxylesterase
MKKLFLCLSVVLCTLAVSAQQVAKSLTASNGQFIGFWQYTPTDYNANPNKKYPLIIFLHGIGERGNGTTDLPSLLGYGPSGAINSGSNMTFTFAGKTETFLVLTPQLDPKYGWWPNFYADEMIAYATKNLRIDPNRIILTGLSLGGGGTWAWAGASLANAQKLAAIGVSCGTCQNLDFCNIAKANLPTWAFHAQDDGTVGVGCTTSQIQAINNCNPAVKPYMTIWPSGQHWIWGRVYSTDYSYQNPNIWEWFMAQDKSKAPNQRPVAVASQPLPVLSSLGIVVLDGSKSSDPDGRIVRYVWTKTDGPYAGSVLASVSTESSSLTITGLNTVGTYTYELKVVDDRADWSTSTVTVTVGLGGPPPTNNKVPVSNAGANVTTSASSITLNGTGSDPDGYVAAYSWTKVSGPTGGNIASPSAGSTSVTGLTTGTYVFRFSVTDNNNAITSDDVTVTVGSGTPPANKLPVSNAGSDVTITLPTNSVSLTGSGSDPDGYVAGYAWTKVSGPSSGTIASPAANNTSITQLAQGTYVFRLTVTDNNNAATSDDVTVTVNPVADKPDNGGGTSGPNAGADVTITLPTNSATLDGSASTDATGAALKSFKWTKLSGPSSATLTNAAAKTTTVTGLTEGTYQFQLTVWDNQWVPRADVMTLTVKASTGGTAPPPPATNKIANAGADISISLPTNSVTLNGSASSDPNGQIKSWQWAKISGPSSGTIVSNKAAVTNVTNLSQGTYKFQLLVWDNQWVPRGDTMQVTVRASSGGSLPAEGSIANAGEDITVILPGNSATLNGSASADLNGSIKAWQWIKIDGPEQHNIANASVSTTTVSNLVEGTYLFRLIVWDNGWVPYADTVQIDVINGDVTSRSVTGASTAALKTETVAIATAAADKLLVYPNPAQGQLNVQTTSTTTGASLVNIYDMSGKLIRKSGFQKTAALHQQSINVAGLTPGLYQVEVVIDNQKRLNSKFIKQ